MILAILFIGLAILAFMFYEDLRFRGIQWWAFLGLSLFAILYQYLRSSSLDFLVHIPFSISISVLLLTSVLALYWLKSKKPIQDSMGLGDLLFILAITPLFDTLNFIVFLSISFIGAAVLHLLMQLIKKSKTVPLAGYQCLILAVYLCLDYLHPISLTDSLNFFLL